MLPRLLVGSLGWYEEGPGPQWRLARAWELLGPGAWLESGTGRALLEGERQWSQWGRQDESHL